ncbi:GTPase Era [Oceanibacterium hippocampi]|uniref:GTPase Era n=1 Tax=Oceanibacterium hippocampi TaxID=745714 RepID=A0A1Y5U4W7_9PROT|nr:GTPase Era [Oceanibacterium hippocampi]SLN77062.1 GTPase Era [Oceanibacterium hippocampi]
MTEPTGPEAEGTAETTRAGFIALIGATNAGKSTLLNTLVGSKIAIVSPKVQTTRTRITGIAMAGPAQLVFVDTPGIFQPRRRLDRAMVEAAWSGAADADMVVLLVDSKRGLTGDVREIVRRLEGDKRPLVLALNKVDSVKRVTLLDLAQQLSEMLPFEAVFMISALTGDGVEDLKAHLAARLPAGPWLFPEDQLATASLRQLAAEITREQLYTQLHEELPYATTVETESWKDAAKGAVRIEQVIYVARETQKAIVLGKGGSMIKKIGAAARAELETILDGRVHLFLFVKVRPRWEDDPERYREMGLDYSD